MKKKMKSTAIKFVSILVCLTVLIAVKGFDVFAATATSSAGAFTVTGIPTNWATSATLSVSNYNTSVINALAAQYGGSPTCTALWATSHNSIFSKWSNGSIYEHTSSGMTICSDIPSSATMAAHANDDGYGTSPYFYIDSSGNLYGKGGWLGYSSYTYLYAGVTYISTSGDHAVATTSSGNVIGFGNNTYGQCASNDFTFSASARTLYSGGNAIKASAMGQTSYVLTSSAILSCGSNTDGALGINLNDYDETTGYDEEGNPIINYGLQYQTYFSSITYFEGTPVDIYCGRFVAQSMYYPTVYFTGSIRSSLSIPRAMSSVTNMTYAASTGSGTTYNTYYKASGSLYCSTSPSTALCSVASFGTYNNSCYALTSSGSLYQYNGTSGTLISPSTTPTYYVSGIGTYTANGSITLSLMMLCGGSYIAVDTCNVTLSYIDSAAPAITVTASPAQNAGSISLVPTATDAQSGLSAFTYVTSANTTPQPVTSGQTISVPSSISSITFTATDAVGRTATSAFTVSATGYTPPSLLVTGNPTSAVSSATLNLATGDAATVTINGTAITHKSTTLVSYQMKIGSGGSYTTLSSNSATITANGTYYFKATDSFGVLTAEVSVAVTNISGGSITFIPDSYNATIPSSGNTTVSTTAQVTDANGNVVSGAAITYGLVGTPTGVSINSGTGVVTITSAASASVVQISATYNSLNCTASLNLTAPGLSLSITSGQVYKVSMTADNVSNFSGKTYTVTYDPSALQVKDLCAFTYETELAPCTIAQTGITITSFSPGQITYTVNKTITSGKTWSGTVNIFEFTALTTGTTGISKQ